MYWSFKMGFVRDTLGIKDVKSFFLGGKADILDFGGVQGEEDALEASKLAEEEQLDALGRSIAETRRSTEAGQSFLQPFGEVGQQGAAQAGFLTDPKAQFDFLQNNSLFQIGLDNANRQTQQVAASRGRLSAGDTLQQLNQNALLTAAPLIAQQKQSIGDLLNFGGGIATNQANVAIGEGSTIANAFENQGNVSASGIMGRNQIGQDTTANQQKTALTIASMFASDPALKTDIVRTGEFNGHNLYRWSWNDKANSIGLYGESSGVMADEVKLTNPDAVITDTDGYMKVNYEMIGVKH